MARVFHVLVILFATTTLVVGGASLLSQMNRDFFWEEEFNEFRNLGEDCRYAFVDSLQLSAINIADLSFSSIRVPFRKAGIFPHPPPDKHLLTQCEVLDIDASAKMVWFYLGYFYGDNFVYIDNRLVFESSGNTLIEFPLSKEEISKTHVTISIVSSGNSDIKPIGPISLVPAVMGYHKLKIDVMREALSIWEKEIPAYGLGFCLGLIILFSVGWAYGIRYPDVGWLIILNASISVYFGYNYTPFGNDFTYNMKLLYGAIQVLIVCSVFGFLVEFFRLGRALRPGWITTAILVLYGTVIIFVSQESFQEWRLQARVPLITGSILAFIAALAGGYDFRKSISPKERYFRRALLVVVSFVVSLLMVAQVILEDVNGFVFANYLFYGIAIIFSAVTAFDLFIYRNRMLRAEIEAQTQKVIVNAAQMIAHDLRRPLGVLGNMLASFENRPDPQELQNDLRDMVPDIEELIEDVRSMLEDINEIGSKRKIQLESLDLSSLLSKCIDMACHGKNVDRSRFKTDISPESYVFVDKLKIERLFLNLIINALEASPEEKCIKISVERKGSRWLCIVSNHGKQIPPDKVERLFEPFYTFDKSHGTGLGLAIVKKIASEHGFVVKVTSRDDGLTTFSFSLDRYTPKAREVGSRQNRVRFLIIDDDPFSAERWQKSFPEYNTVILSSPEMLQSCLERDSEYLSSFDCAIVDYHYDNSCLSGLDATEMIIARKTDLLIFVSSFNPDGVPEALANKVNGVIAKEPRSWEELRNLGA